jgi:hypothetical protein
MAAEGEIITLSPDSLTFMGLRITVARTVSPWMTRNMENVET